MMQSEMKPRMTQVKEIRSPEDILPALSNIVKRVPQRGFNEGLGLKAGERVYMVTDNSIDPILTEALVEAIREARGVVDRVDLEGYHDLTDPIDIVDTIGGHNWFPDWVWEGAKQADVFLRMAFMKFPHVPNLPIPMRSRSPRILEWEIPPDILLSSCMTFPLDVWDAIDRKTWETYQGARRVEVTDNDGTNLTFDLTEKDWEPEADIFKPGHLFIPFPQDCKLHGVIAFRSLTFGGPIPLTKLHIEDRRVVEVEGGGTFGDRLRESFKQYQNATYEKLPGPGCNWVSTFAFCTNPKYRRSPIYPQVQSSARVHAWCLGHRRSGIIHASVGSALETPKHKLIRHFELMSPTIVADDKVVIREGHLTSLDDPEVRRIAQKHGDPDEILLEDWIPNPETAI